jgi:thiol-disulfide isomerase/thioredoxin
MKYLLISMVCLLAIWTSHVSIAGEFNQVLSIGDAAPSWNDLPGVDGKSHSLADLKDSKAIVVVFTCNSCPYAVDVEDRLVALNNKYSDKGVSLVAVNVNQVEDDRLPAMKQKAEAKKFEFAYLFDETQKIAKEFGAKYTPEFFVIDGERKVAYMGAMDDSPDGRKVTKSYVDSAIESVLAGGRPDVTETVPIGCRVRMEREPRSR